MNLNPSRTHFPPAMLAACEAALDAGIFYNDQFDDFVFKHMGGFGCDAVLIEVVDLDGAAPDFWDAQRDYDRGDASHFTELTWNHEHPVPHTGHSDRDAAVAEPVHAG